MSSATLAADGIKAVEARNFPLAITKLTTALTNSTSPNPNPSWLIARSKAFNATSNFVGALEDADLALHSAFGRGSKSFIIDAHHRRAVAFNRLGRQADADACCVWALNLLAGGKSAPKEDPADGWTDQDGFWKGTMEDFERDAKTHPLNKSAKPGDSSANPLAGATEEATAETKTFNAVNNLRMMVVRKLVSLDEKDDARKRTAKMMPPKKKLYLPEGLETAPLEKPKAAPAVIQETTSEPTQTLPPQVPVAQDANLRIDHYETDATINATIFSKGVDKEKLQVHFTESTVALSAMKYPNGVEKELVVSLTGAVKPDECSFRVTPSKVELKLVKAQPGKWKSLGEQGIVPPAGEQKVPESNLPPLAATPSNTFETDASSASAKVDPTSSKDSGPAYPTSSKKPAPKDWNKYFEEELDNDNESKDVNDFFKNIYAGASPEAQRAMMKSFTESNGTSLSTNWDEVGKGKVETVPPEGVEAKKW